MLAVRPTSMLRLPRDAEAHEPPEARGLRRDDVRLLVSRGDADPVHARFADLPHFLDAGDVVVVNTSATIPAALDARTEAGVAVRIHLSTLLPGDLWLVEVRRPAGVFSMPLADDLRGTSLALRGGGTVDILERYAGSMRLWFAMLHLSEPLGDYLSRWGQPIRYAYIDRAWPIETYQTVYATQPGSAEMPSAGRPFTTEVITALVAAGVDIAPLVLHTGVSSLEGDETPYPERFTVPVDTARRINAARAAGRRVVAVGTTVVRALESVVDPTRAVHPGSGWTDVVVTPERGVTAVDGLLTGFHEPAATHLWMLEAIVDRAVLRRAYTEALERGYRWHEFGDSHLALRDHA